LALVALRLGRRCLDAADFDEAYHWMWSSISAGVTTIIRRRRA